MMILPVIGAVTVGELMLLAFGTVAGLILVGAVVIRYATLRYYRQYLKDVTAGLKQSANSEKSLLTEADTAQLPEPVRKYLNITGSMYKPKVSHFKVEFTGKIRKDEQSEWMPFTSQQYNFMQSPKRLFFMKAVMKGMPVAGYHRFTTEKASMYIRLFSLFKVQFQKGPEMDLSETVTFFNDMCCLAPPTLIDSRITWLTVHDNSVNASFKIGNMTVSAWLFFNEEGQLINFISEDRYSADAGKQLPWAHH